MEGLTKKCFVCDNHVDNQNSSINVLVNLPVCNDCKNTGNEKMKEAEFLDSLAEGFVCGCI